MKRLIILTALLTAIAFSFAQLKTATTYIAGFHPPGAPRAGIELPEMDVLQPEMAKGIIPSGKGVIPTDPRG